MAQLGVSVVALDRPATLVTTLDTLRTTLPEGTPLVVVDNGSTDARTLAQLTAVERRGGTVIRNGANRGLSVAVNQGLAHLRNQGCDVLVHLDDDAVIDGPQDWASLLVALFDVRPELGLLVPNGRRQYVEYMPAAGYDNIRWGLGYAWALRGSVYDRIGGYDPHLLHQQECDIALRVRMAGAVVGTNGDWAATHNDPGGTRSELSAAREHLGCVQFRDKWCEYFRGAGWNYGTIPLYLMQHWPPDQEWFRAYAEHYGVELNPPPPEHKAEDTKPGSVLGLSAADEASIPRIVNINGQRYMAYVDLRNEYGHWARGDNYKWDRENAAANWERLTGEKYTGYPWPADLLKPRSAA